MIGVGAVATSLLKSDGSNCHNNIFKCSFNVCRIYVFYQINRISRVVCTRLNTYFLCLTDFKLELTDFAPKIIDYHLESSEAEIKFLSGPVCYPFLF